MEKSKLKSNKVQSARYNNTGVEDMITAQDSGIKSITFNFKTEKDLQDFVMVTGLSQLLTKACCTFEKPSNKINQFF